MISRLAGEGEYRALSALWEGQERAAGLRTAAEAAQIEGKSAQRRAFLKAGASFIDAAPSLWEKYGGDWEEFRDAKTS